MSRSIRINTAQKIYFNNTEVDDVYYNNEHIWPPTPYFVSKTGTDDVSVSGDINNPFQTLAFARSQITNQDTIFFRTGSYEFDEEEITDEETLEALKDVIKDEDGLFIQKTKF